MQLLIWVPARNEFRSWTERQKTFFIVRLSNFAGLSDKRKSFLDPKWDFLVFCLRLWCWFSARDEKMMKNDASSSFAAWLMASMNCRVTQFALNLFFLVAKKVFTPFENANKAISFRYFHKLNSSLFPFHMCIVFLNAWQKLLESAKPAMAKREGQICGWW